MNFTKQSSCIYKFFLLVIWAICLVSFVLNVSFTFESYIRGETIQSVVTEIAQETLNFPSFAICPRKPFRNESHLMLTLEDYDDNAYDPKDFNVNIEYSKNVGSGHGESEYKEAQYLRTQSMGKCLYYEMKGKVWHKSEYLAALASIFYTWFLV